MGTEFPFVVISMFRKGSDFKGTETIGRDQRGVSILGIDRFYNLVQAKLAGEIQEDLPGVGIKINDLEPIEVARQLTILEYDIFKGIKPTEFLDQAWLKDDKLKQAPGICEMANWSTKVTSFFPPFGGVS